MNYSSIFKIATTAIWANRVRSFLTMLGVIIGVSSVVLLTSIGTGLQLYVEEQFASLGTNTLYVVPGNPFGDGGGFGNQEATLIQASQTNLKLSYVNNILRDNRDVLLDGAVTALGVGDVKYQEKTLNQQTMLGTSASYNKVSNSKTEKGVWFSSADDEKSSRVVVLGAEMAEELFGQIDPVNKKIKIESRSYTVLGVLEAKGGGFGGPSFDKYIYLPINTLFDDFNTELVDNFAFLVKSEDLIDDAIVKIEESLLDEGLEDDEFSVFDQTQLLDTIKNILGIITTGLGAIAAISLVVGGIGIMNIMLVSVTERTREIGLRKALGATPKVILVQFLFEAALLSVIGGVMGVLIAYLGSLAIQPYFPAQVTLNAVILAFSVSVVVGLVFGAAPAKRASELSPIEALRYE